MKAKHQGVLKVLSNLIFFFLDYEFVIGRKLMPLSNCVMLYFYSFLVWISNRKQNAMFLHPYLFHSSSLYITQGREERVTFLQVVLGLFCVRRKYAAT